MKITRKPDGTTEIEGAPEEVRALLAEPLVDAVGKMLPQTPFGTYTVRAAAGGFAHNAGACAAAPGFGGQVWIGEIKPAYMPAAGAACAGAAQPFFWSRQ